MTSTVTSQGEAVIDVKQASRIDSRRRLGQAIIRVALPVLVLLVIVIAAITTPAFFTLDNGRAVLINASVVGILAVGMTPITLSGNFVSLAGQGSTVLATMTLLALLSAGVPIWIGVIAVLGLQLVVGVIQGLIVSAGLNPVITTLAAGSVIYGVLTVITTGTVVTAPGSNLSKVAIGSLLSIPIPVYIFVVYTLVMWFLVDRTVIGRRTTLVGANRLTAGISGVSSRSTTIIAFMSFGIAATLAGLIQAAQLGQVTSGDMASLTTDIIAAVLVGGASIKGGEGSPLNSALGAILITIFTNVMLLQGVAEGVRMAFVGALVVIIVCVLHVIRRNGAR
jgi:ribose/xylose/arabinose/galactoside ABC-type transport system permease subunit